MAWIRWHGMSQVGGFSFEARLWNGDYRSGSLQTFEDVAQQTDEIANQTIGHAADPMEADAVVRQTIEDDVTTTESTEAAITNGTRETQNSPEPPLDFQGSVIHATQQVGQDVPVKGDEDVTQDTSQDILLDGHHDISHVIPQDISISGHQDTPQDAPTSYHQDTLQPIDTQGSIQDTSAVLPCTAPTPTTPEPSPSHLPITPEHSFSPPQYRVGLACRLPDTCHNPHDLWNFLMAGGIAKSTPPASRFSLDGHYDASGRNKTMASPGGMFLQDIDPSDVDAQFFKLTPSEAIALDPQQRQLLEVVYEGLENAGVPLERLDGQRVGCFVGSFACDFGDMQARDPEDRAPASAVGVGRAMLSNCISHFLNIRGPSMTIDTACSGSMVGLDVACRYLTTGEMDGAIVAGCNIYLAPEHVMDGANGTASLTGECHTFDEATDGYMKSEAVNMVYVKRLSDALRDGDPIRAVIRGTATNSDGWTAGIGSPDSAAQSRAIRAAYANAGITDLLATSYVECHGTGTRVGDVLEVNGLAAVFSEGRPIDRPLRVGSIKANIGHSEPSAGISGLMKTVLCLEKAIIPGQPTLITPNPKIDFTALKVLPSKVATNWPDVPFLRAGVNSFGYGGSNAHAIVDAADGLGTQVSSYLANGTAKRSSGDHPERPYLLVFSANDEESLKGQHVAIRDHLVDEGVNVVMRDMAHTLSERRTRHFHRGFAVVDSETLSGDSFNTGKQRAEQPRVAFVFTGQGAQWSRMGKDLLETYPTAAQKVRELDEILQKIPQPPSWLLFDTLTQPLSPDVLKRPEISQSACTAFQLAMLAVLADAGVKACSVAGHSSGEIAAAFAAGLLTSEQAIKIAYYRGLATSAATPDEPLGMLAVGLGSEAAAPYLEATSVQVACFNNPASVTLSGRRLELEDVEAKLKAGGHFARMLHVTAAYHSRHMDPVAAIHKDLLDAHVDWPNRVPDQHLPMFSSTTGKIIAHTPGVDYWVKNMGSPVLFEQSVSSMLPSADILIEIGPSNALSGPVTQTKTALSSKAEYIASWKRDTKALHTLLTLGGKLFVAGAPVHLATFNADNRNTRHSVIVDLPNYRWNHSTKYWYENDASRHWRFKKFIYHDLLGSKILGAPWTRPVFRNRIKMWELPFLRDHKIGESLIFPASGYVVMAVEGMFQNAKACGRIAATAEIHQVGYAMRDIGFLKAFQIDDGDRGTSVLLTLIPETSTPDTWHEFIVSSVTDDVVSDHCRGRISIAADQSKIVGTDDEVKPLVHASRASLWYNAMTEVGYNFGPSFQRLLEIEATAGIRKNRALVTFAVPESKAIQSHYPIHPSAIDSCFQAGAPSLWSGHRSTVGKMLLPVMIDELVIQPQSARPEKGIAVAEAMYQGVGREDDPQRYKTHTRVFDEQSGEMLMRVSGLQFHAGEAVNSVKPHPFTQVKWRPDISFTSPGQLAKMLDGVTAQEGESAAMKVAELIDLISHKTPNARILEVNLEGSDSFWVNEVRDKVSQVTVDCEFHLSVGAELAEKSHEAYDGAGNVQIDQHDPEDLFAETDPEKLFKLVIVKVSPGYKALEKLLQSAQKVLASDGTILVLDEMFSSIISAITDEQIAALKKLVERRCRLLWVTVGGQMRVTRPESALFIGVERALLSEDPSALIMSLDVESVTAPGSLAAVVASVRHIASIDSFEFGDNEFAERDDEPGAFDSLYRKETTEGDVLEDDKVEIEIHATAMNLKDVADALGFVPAHEHRFGLEGAGVVTRVGNAVETYKIGDRVIVLNRDGGCFANRDATAMGFSYSSSLYSLIDLANLQKGEIVLIQNATDGVGLAAIQVCRYLGAEIYVTVATQEERDFLHTNCAIPQERMFSSSSSVAFAPLFMAATNNHGADVVLNTLTGDILHETWRCIADNGRFIELSRKDSMGRNNLSMEPFSRNACYRSFDLSYKSVTHALSQRLLALTMKLASEGYITPIHIGKTFGFEEIVEAFRYRRDGKGIGKIMITNTDRDAVKVPTKLYAAPFQLKSNVSYLISGGLKGLCGSLAIYMARQGAKNIVALSRSGHDDKVSQSVVHQLTALGTTVDLIRGDVTNIDDVRQAFNEASMPIAGLIQGAMMLRDKLFPSMTPEEFRAPLEPKVRGTWNLHTVAAEQTLPLDFFTMLSSISGLIGHSAQANYAAGNVFEDAFAAHRRSLGSPACAVNLGLIKDVGYFTDREHFSRRLESKGWPPINETLLHRILRLAILQQTDPINPESASQLVTGIPYPLTKASPLKPEHRFSALRPAAGAVGAAETGDTHLALIRRVTRGAEEADHDTLLAAIVEVINGTLRRSLGWAEPLEPSRPLASYGIDSLVAVELRNWVRSELSVEISVVEVVGAKTLVSLCEVILKKLQVLP
ncbi:hypothetical protein F5X68DRAFT_276598 [Plectosphaerella plurivora]|uniref:Polyketide synthase n=1 Tax=Plectosphaerella plurivora TaxID=936078 RepID=A0A9P9AA26_9PEZI|nr:hypothetical protein F5X68DRAFT_276598 [Plectosphaerella plurivora]